MFEVVVICRKPKQLVYNSYNEDVNLMLDEDDWTEVEELCKFLKTFYQATNTISAQYTPTISSVLVTITAISKVLVEYKKLFPYKEAIEAMIEKF